MNSSKLPPARYCQVGGDRGRLFRVGEWYGPADPDSDVREALQFVGYCGGFVTLYSMVTGHRQWHRRAWLKWAGKARKAPPPRRLVLTVPPIVEAGLGLTLDLLALQEAAISSTLMLEPTFDNLFLVRLKARLRGRLCGFTEGDRSETAIEVEREPDFRFTFPATRFQALNDYCTVASEGPGPCGLFVVRIAGELVGQLDGLETCREWSKVHLWKGSP